MKSALRLLLPVLLVMAVLALGITPSAKADEIYSFSDQEASWSFQVPSLITTNTLITNFLSFTVVPGSFFSTGGCAGTGSADLELVGGNFRIVTSKGFCEQIDTGFGGFPGEGTIGIGEEGSLTISPASSGVPEPSSLLLLAGGLASLVGLRRKRN
jgi:hypothetical protein